MEHQQPDSLPAEPVTMMDHVRVAIESVDMLGEFLDRVFGEDTKATANDATPEVVCRWVGGQQLLPQVLEVLLTPHLLQQSQIEALQVQKVPQALHAVRSVLAQVGDGPAVEVKNPQSHGEVGLHGGTR